MSCDSQNLQESKQQIDDSQCNQYISDLSSDRFEIFVLRALEDGCLELPRAMSAWFVRNQSSGCTPSRPGRRYLECYWRRVAG